MTKSQIRAIVKSLEWNLRIESDPSSRERRDGERPAATAGNTGGPAKLALGFWYLSLEKYHKSRVSFSLPWNLEERDPPYALAGGEVDRPR